MQAVQHHAEEDRQGTVVLKLCEGCAKAVLSCCKTMKEVPDLCRCFVKAIWNMSELFQICFKSTSEMFQIYVRDVPNLRQRCAESTSEMCQIYVRDVPNLCQRCAKSTSEMCQINIRDVPQDLRHCSTLSSFKAKLKTFLFSQYFCPNKYPDSAAACVCVRACVRACCPWFIILYVNCFGRTVLCMCVEYRI